MDFVECCRTGSRPEAEMIGQILVAQNIRCVVSCDDAGGGLPGADTVARVLVGTEDLDAACAMVKALQNQPDADVHVRTRKNEKDLPGSPTS
jgi:hypothetical protein